MKTYTCAYLMCCIPCIGERLNDVYFLTNKYTSDEEPNVSGNWNICYQSEAALGADFAVQCTDNQTPVTKEFSIRTYNGRSIELRQVEVYGYGEYFLRMFEYELTNCRS